MRHGHRRRNDPARVAAFLERTDSLAVQAMRKCFGHHRGDPGLTPEERAALDAFLEPRLAALVDELMARMEVQPAPYGPKGGRGWSRREQPAPSARTP